MRCYLQDIKDSKDPETPKSTTARVTAHEKLENSIAQKVGGWPLLVVSVGLSIFQDVQLVLISSRRYLLRVGLSESGPHQSLLFNILSGKGFGGIRSFPGIS